MKKVIKKCVDNHLCSPQYTDNLQNNWTDLVSLRKSIYLKDPSRHC